ncbi:RNA splicing factor Pad-1 [Pseudohyphozyma bogoriensis]|nr:RNA splicing factor Pad-1 [Pseudohyphozyma bogoriensis]
MSSYSSSLSSSSSSSSLRSSTPPDISLWAGHLLPLLAHLNESDPNLLSTNPSSGRESYHRCSPRYALDVSHSHLSLLFDPLIELLEGEKADFVEIEGVKGKLFYTLQRHYDDESGDESGWWVLSETKVGMNGEKGVSTTYVVLESLEQTVDELDAMMELAELESASVQSEERKTSFRGKWVKKLRDKARKKFWDWLLKQL